jgi:hypothetical protein
MNIIIGITCCILYSRCVNKLFTSHCIRHSTAHSRRACPPPLRPYLSYRILAFLAGTRTSKLPSRYGRYSRYAQSLPACLAHMARIPEKALPSSDLRRRQATALYCKKSSSTVRMYTEPPMESRGILAMTSAWTNSRGLYGEQELDGKGARACCRHPLQTGITEIIRLVQS